MTLLPQPPTNHLDRLYGGIVFTCIYTRRDYNPTHIYLASHFNVTEISKLMKVSADERHKCEDLIRVGHSKVN